jgi:S-adenosyl-L-methionine hydrolase (adenosine-forming)
MSPAQTLTLLSDFGDSDVYVGVMKGIIAQINPSIQVVDLTHKIPPQNIATARFCLMSAYSYFPQGTVHLAVVDPGVGSLRRAVAVKTALGFLVAPDNGILGGVLSQNQTIQSVELTNSRYWRIPNVSHTFHGRDIFAPVAAHLASGVSLLELGTEIDPATLVELDLPKCRQIINGVVGCVQYIDVFGNLITNIPGNYVQGRKWCVNVIGLRIPGEKTYSHVEIGNAVALVGSEGWIEIGINRGNAQLQLQIQLAETVELEFLN